ncbi:bifunctional ADP-dependent NAD(P)H-hydrate dehydratase/NAD(P)H-hydrate epimerase [Saccharibacillus kuerlensis]|uniref:Bifunctional NAD(P)H-hydrate repair enzyme n=1 Tax=Saccharibacillus kuerlensis TaxID=459527 RepID=A0ABQ2L4L0_9BACL|nr:bifunctional ADP-dependent NAD(P)H-hydrate dehydratase/NAD(P)H-hydrate epimerase [Saccharibacillus kuerlensis]GGN99826.1 bifunctional NAD(P)H-hydrate repair enzyme Nnr [Saccharibacillus kuerlensis]
MQIVTAQQMKQIDRYTIDELGIPALALMESAGRAVAEEVLDLCRSRRGMAEDGRTGAGTRPDGSLKRGVTSDNPIFEDDLIAPFDGAEREHWLILTGKGNNGGDGLAAARYLQDAGVRVSILCAESPDRFTEEAAVQFEAVRRSGILILETGQNPAAADFTPYTGLVDALLGVGASGEPREPYAGLIKAANGSGLPIVAADVPSGLDADTGQTPEACIRAVRTVCIAFLKAGLVQYPGAEAAGEVKVRAVGIPQLASSRIEERSDTYLITERSLRVTLGIDTSRKRAEDSHKGTYGHVLVVGGSRLMSGAGFMASRAALRIGSGLVTWALPKALLPNIVGHVPELMVAEAAEGDAWRRDSAGTILKLAERMDVLAVGPGLGRFDGDMDWMKELWTGSDVPLVIDADGLNILADAGGALKDWGRRENVVLTPHPGEMGRLLGIPTAELQRDRIGAARKYAAEYGVTLVLKGARTVVASPDGTVFVNTTGHPGMSTGGTGDVLTGAISGLIAQKLSPLQAASFGVYLHGRAGERAAELREHPSSLLAGDVIEAL